MGTFTNILLPQKNICVAKEFCFRRLRNVVDNRCLLLSIHSALPSNAQKFLCLN